MRHKEELRSLIQAVDCINIHNKRGELRDAGGLFHITSEQICQLNMALLGAKHTFAARWSDDLFTSEHPIWRFVAGLFSNVSRRKRVVDRYINLRSQYRAQRKGT